MILITKTCVCVCVCVFTKLHITAQSGPALSSESFYATHIDPPKGGCVCVCVFFSSHLLWTSSSLDEPAKVTQDEGHTGFLILLPSAVHVVFFLARRIQPFLCLADREVEPNFVYYRFNRSPSAC